MRWLPRIMFVAGVLVLTSCGGSGSSGEGAATTVPDGDARCDPSSIPELLPAVSVTDTAVRRIPMVPGKMAFDPGDLAGLESEAGVSPLGAYVVYLADFDIPDAELSGASRDQLTPSVGTEPSLAVLTVVPPSEAGLTEGGTVLAGDLGYETITDLQTLDLDIQPADLPADGEVTGQVEVLEASADELCLDVDVALLDGGDEVASMRGIVVAPVVDAANAAFLN